MPVTAELKRVDIYTDGACIGNPGPGGYGAILDFRGQRKELSEGFRLTTNNRMELLATIRGLEALKEPCEVTLCSDSLYVIKGIELGWAKRWRANGWRKGDKTPAVNSDLWATLLDLCGTHAVSFTWVKGHDGHVENERCDTLANTAARTNATSIDSVYEGLPRATLLGTPL